MSDYLFDKSGKADPDVEALEQKLAPLRYQPRSFDALLEQAPKAGDVVRLDERRRTEIGRRTKLAAMLAVTAGAAAALWLLSPKPPRQVLTADRIGRPVEAPWRQVEARLRPGEWLETGAEWEARVSISDIGRVDVAPSTRLRLTEDSPTKQRLELARGKIHAKVNAPPEIFVVGTPAAEAIDLGCEYTLDVDEHGNGELVVKSGWVALEGPSRWAYVPAGARSPMQKEHGPGVPLYDDAPESLRKALARFEAGEAKDEAIAVVLRDARRKDSLTLFHLLHRVDPAARHKVYERLAQLAPPPKGVDEPKVLRLDRPALESWGAQMSITW